MGGIGLGLGLGLGIHKFTEGYLYLLDTGTDC